MSYDNIECIYTHPNNIERLKREIQEQREDSEYVYRNPLNDIEIISCNTLNEYVEDETKYERTDILPDSKFISWVEDLDNPPSWAIYLGLVRRPKIYLFYAVSKKNSCVFDPLTNSPKMV